jgi:sigma-B regulation protein RsbU (phosphoserine phosphatase)
MASLEASLRAQAAVKHDLVDLIRQVNRLVCEASSSNRYATLFYAEYDPRTLQLSYVNAGHNPPIVLRYSANGCEVMRLETGGPVIGLLRQSYQQEAFPLRTGDQIVLFTDGISESLNTHEEEWGENQLIQCVKNCRGLSTHEAMAKIFAAADAFSAGTSQHDDMTLVVLRVLV